MKSDGGSFAHLSLHVGTDWRVICNTYPDTTPILSVDGGNCSVSFSAAGRTEIPASAVRFARELARQAGAFAAECERLHTEARAEDTGHHAA